MLQQQIDYTKNNNFNLIRIYLSLSVVFFHCYELSAASELRYLNRFFNGERAVEAFFIISGYLIMKSYQRSTSSKDFFIKRVKRIYPAYVTVVLLCALLGVFVSTYSASAYFSSIDLYHYIGANLAFLNFLQPDLPGVFDGNLFSAVNGSLWTLKIEVGYYLTVPLIVFMCSRFNTNAVYLLLFLTSLVFFTGMKHLYSVHQNTNYLFLSRQLPGQLFYFILGAWCTEFEKKKFFLPLVGWLGLPSLVALFLPLPLLLQSLLLTIVVFFCAFSVRSVSYPFKRNDISYGLYIFHFPVIQVFIYWQLYIKSAYVGFVMSCVVTVVLAVLSWVLIERPFIIPGKKRSTYLGGLFFR